MNKKGQISQIQSLIVPLVGIAIVLVVGFLIIAEVKSQANKNTDVYPANHSYAYNASNTVMEALDDIPGWIPIIVVAVIGAILIGLVQLFRQ